MEEDRAAVVPQAKLLGNKRPAIAFGTCIRLLPVAAGLSLLTAGKKAFSKSGRREVHTVSSSRHAISVREERDKRPFGAIGLLDEEDEEDEEEGGEGTESTVP